MKKTYHYTVSGVCGENGRTGWTTGGTVTCEWSEAQTTIMQHIIRQVPKERCPFDITLMIIEQEHAKHEATGTIPPEQHPRELVFDTK